jgi:hypothetical protein
LLEVSISCFFFVVCCCVVGCFVFPFLRRTLACPFIGREEAKTTGVMFGRFLLS